MPSGAYICDLRHYMDDNGALVRGDALGRFAAFLASVVESACVRAGEGYVTTPVACSRRPKRAPCPAFITAGIVTSERGQLVEWSCPGCGMYGITSGWEGSAHDLRAAAAVTPKRHHGGPQVRFGIDRDTMRVLRTPGLVSQRSAVVLAGARPWPSGRAEIVAPLVVIEQLLRELSDNDATLPAGTARRRLRQAVAVIEAAVAARSATTFPVTSLVAPMLPQPAELSPVEAAADRLRSGENALRQHARHVEPRSRALYASLAGVQRSLILTTGAIWPEVALEAARRMMAVLAGVGGHVQDEDEIAVLIEDLAADIVALARAAGAPVLPELERMVALHEADQECLLTKVPRGLARAGLSSAERDYLASRGLLADEPLDSRRQH